MRDTYKTLVRKPENKRPLEKPRHRWDDNIKMYLKAVVYEGVDWIQLGHA
jgi:hypothetical protein